MNLLKKKLYEGKVCLGTHISLCDPCITELLGNIGYDYLWIDTEHTAIDLQTLQLHLIAARASGTPAIVRVPCVDQVRAKPVLEMGPDGIVFPQVNSYELARTAIEACTYPPKGNRGFGSRRAVHYGQVSLDDYYREVDDNLLKLLQVENAGAVEDFERIVTVEGIDGFIIGPCDLAASMGHFNDVFHPKVVDSMKYVIDRSHKAGIPIGVSFGACRYEDIEFWKSMGVDMISLAADTDHLLRGGQSYLKDMKKSFFGEKGQ